MIDRRPRRRCPDCGTTVIVGPTLNNSCMKCSGYDVRSLRKLIRLTNSEIYEPPPPRTFFLNEQHEI